LILARLIGELPQLSCEWRLSKSARDGNSKKIEAAIASRILIDRMRERGMNLEHRLTLNFSAQTSTATPSPLQSVAQSAAYSPLVLLIDDDAVSRMHLRICLEKDGYRIAEARTGAEGLQLYSYLHPDIVLLDVLMPGIDGFECCAQLRVLPGSDRTPILMITRLEDQKSVDRAFDAGATDFITKPIHFAVLRQRVRRLIQQSQLQHQMELSNQELRQLASIDSLTQVANRRRFDEYLDQEWQRILCDRQPLSLVLCDIDCFKVYNDTYGHQKGDRCLQQVAQAIQYAAQRPTDLVARYGGEEFAILLPNTAAERAVQVANAVFEQVRALAIPHANSPVSCTVTLSAGVVSLSPDQPLSPSQPSTLEEFIATADRALYQAKKSGRDRCCLDAVI
jgi:diguanylate cyclase (GGDEF)-like protein